MYLETYMKLLGAHEFPGKNNPSWKRLKNEKDIQI